MNPSLCSEANATTKWILPMFLGSAEATEEKCFMTDERSYSIVLLDTLKLRCLMLIENGSAGTDEKEKLNALFEER